MNDTAKAEMKTIVDLLRQWNDRHNRVNEVGDMRISVTIIDCKEQLYCDVMANPGEPYAIRYTTIGDAELPYPDPETEAPWNGIGGTE